MLMQGFHIRNALQDDLPALVKLYRHLSSTPDPCPLDVGVTSLETLAQFPGSSVFLGFAADQLVSSCTLIVIPNLTRGGRPYALIENVVTEIAFRKQGIAQGLLDVATDRAWSLGCYKVMLMTGSDDLGTLAFYEKAGFSQSKTGFQKRNLSVLV